MNYVFKILACCLLITCISPYASVASIDKPITIKILGINDFHGQISKGIKLNQREVGSAPILAAYIKNAQIGYESSSLITLMGDQISASPPASGLLNDEPTILFLSTLANKACRSDNRMNPSCNMVATIGNHEFDKGQQALLEKIYGSNKQPFQQWIDLPRYPGASYPHVSSNIVDEKTNQPIFPAYVIKEIKGIKIAFIGAILKDATEVIVPNSAKGLVFLDEATTINHYVKEVKSQGANIVVVIIHQGGYQKPYEGSTQINTVVKGKIVDVIKELDSNVDLVMSGHTHDFTNAYVPNKQGKQILLTEANSYSASFAEVMLTIDRKTKSLINESARIITTYADTCPLAPENLPGTHVVQLAEAKVAPMFQDKITELQSDLIKKVNGAGESDLGDFVADAMRYEAGTDIAIMNPGGLRANLSAGGVTYGHLYAVQPFGDTVLRVSLTGQDIYDLFEQQWTPNNTIFLQISGLSYQYDMRKPISSRIVKVYRNGKELDRNAIYTVATNYFLFKGGDGFAAMTHGQLIAEVDKDLNVLIHYFKSLPQPINYVPGEKRIQEVCKQLS